MIFLQSENSGYSSRNIIWKGLLLMGNLKGNHMVMFGVWETAQKGSCVCYFILKRAKMFLACLFARRDIAWISFSSGCLDLRYYHQRFFAMHFVIYLENCIFKTKNLIITLFRPANILFLKIKFFTILRSSIFKNFLSSIYSYLQIFISYLL